MVALNGGGRVEQGGFGGGAGKRAYVKPLLVTHGSVQQLTEGGHHYDDRSSRDSGSNIHFKPNPIDGKIFGDW